MHALEAAVRASPSRLRDRCGMAQQALGRHHHQRLAPGASTCRRRQWKYLRRRGGLHDLDVVLGGQRQEALEPGARVLRALAFEAMGQEQHQAAQALPLVFGAGDELVDDHLGRVHEVAELGLPDHQPVRAVEAVAVLEAQHARFRTAGC